MKFLIMLAAVLGATVFAAVPDGNVHEMPESRDLRADTASGKPLVVMFARSDCGYCERLEAEQFVPMLISGRYRDRVTIRKLSLDPGISVVDVDGRSVATELIARRYGVMVTPTVLLLGPAGRELAERLVGSGLPDFYGAYLDRAIGVAERQLKAPGPKSRNAAASAS